MIAVPGRSVSPRVIHRTGGTNHKLPADKASNDVKAQVKPGRNSRSPGKIKNLNLGKDTNANVAHGSDS